MAEQPTRSVVLAPEASASDAAAEQAPTADQSGEAADGGPPIAPPGYELLEEIGRGGMGVVYRAREVALNRGVAVKMLRGHYPADSPAARRFLEESLITGQLQHPGIPPVHQVGTLPDGRPFLAMKLVKGRTLEDFLKDRKKPAEGRGRFLAIFEQVCQAVACAHDHKVIHRDLKPANVMVGAFAEVQVMDWGLAKPLSDSPAPTEAEPGPEQGAATVIRTLRDSDGSFTQAGSVMGTPAFMPPEQAGGEVERIDERSDVFGLGAILCVILTGKPPFVAKDAEAVRLMAIRGQLEECLARLDGCGAEPELVALCKRCLAADPADRPRNAGELAAAVAGLRAAADERARQAELEKVRAEGELRAAEMQAAEQRKRRRVQAALGLAFTALVVLGGAFAWWMDRQTAERKAEVENRDRDERERLARNAAAVESLLARCEEALHRDDAATAGLLVKEAERQAAEGGAERLADRKARCRADFDLLSELDRIDALRWSVVAGRPQREKALQEWPGAFGRYGIVPGSTAPEAAARRVRESLVQERLLTALDLWLVHSPSAELAAILRLADPDQFRTEMREAIQARSPMVTRLASQPEALNQPARFAIVLGSLGAVTVDRRKAILYAVLDRRSADFGVLMTLGRLYPINTAATADAREMWFRAALAAKPGSVAAVNSLGIALLDNGDRDGAAAAFREAIRLDPKFAHAYNNLGAALNATRDPNGAIASFRQAARFETKSPIAHINLGNALRAAGDLEGAIASYRKAATIDPTNRATRRAMVTLLLLTGEADKGESLVRQYVAEERANLGDGTVALSHRLAEYGEELVDHGRMAAAEPLLRESLAIRDRLAPDAWYSLYTAAYLGLALASQGKGAEAEPLLTRGYNGLRGVAVPSPWQHRVPDHLRSIAEHLALLNEAAGKLDEARRWRAEAAKYPSIAPAPREVKRP